ncbi:protein phosphatase 1 regulatory subunit 37 homolog isoform X2 [Aplysia californica]|uniref:Protein phosphatase 1 regulatory subunit 37 homolog isoform X2 n=1 Tax=Aplysia californica TaxID=6500 RepID=A0ABM0JJM2_APLCA|nr:protein phosphatase 1 regulatory subunit 37 homolog isoform X2 [Aplysia californica]
MAEHKSAAEVPVVVDPLQTADYLSVTADAGKGDTNVNKINHENVSSNMNGETLEPMKQTSSNTSPLCIDSFIGNESVGVNTQDNKTYNNNASTAKQLQEESKQTEKSGSGSSLLYNKVTTVTDQVPFHPAVNGPSNVNGSNQNHRKDQSTKQKRGISFPKDTFISGYFEPPDPWKNAPSWDTNELISAYKTSCELHGTKPIIKVLQQLSTIAGPGKREELFSLKGEKLEQKQCEGLEEVLRRVQFKLLDLEASHLDDECAVALFDMIEYYESACQLNISCNKDISARGWQACSRLVRRTPTLTYLDMRGCDLNDRTIPIFGRALKLGCHLTILHMEKMNLSGRPLIILVAALKMNETLQELFLADNKLMPTDGAQLGTLMRYNHKLSLLDLRNNHLQDVGTSHICDGLMEQNKGRGLRTLVLWNNSITYQAMPPLGRALAASESLETLNIGHNNITNEGVHLLKDGLLKTNTLLRLGLQGTKVSDEGSVALAEYIADSLILLRIDLRDNDIKTGGLMALSHAMRVNSSVTRIDLDKETKRESGMKDYAEQQNRLQRDIITFQQRNVQAAIEREEAERAKLEEKAEAAAAARQKEAEEKQEEEDASPPPAPVAGGEAVADAKVNGSSGESFTVISKEGITDKEVSSEDSPAAEVSEQPDSSVVVSEASSQPCDEVAATCSDDDKLCESKVKAAVLPCPDSPVERQQQQQPNLRPSNLFGKSGLHPQESLDSPLPCAISDNPMMLSEGPDDGTSSSSDEDRLPSAPGGDSTPGKKSLSLIVGAPPGEMLLSPQYYPKQLARKIFSVSRVSEDGSQQLSCSPSPSSSPLPHPLSGAFDPLNISTVPLESSSSATFSSSSSPSPSLSESCSSSGQGSDPPTSVSPASLVQDLATETVKQMECELQCDGSASVSELARSSSPPTSPGGDDDDGSIAVVSSGATDGRESQSEPSSDSSVTLSGDASSTCRDAAVEASCDRLEAPTKHSETAVEEKERRVAASTEGKLENPGPAEDSTKLLSGASDTLGGGSQLSALPTTSSTENEPNADVSALAENKPHKQSWPDEEACSAPACGAGVSDDDSVSEPTATEESAVSNGELPAPSTTPKAKKDSAMSGKAEKNAVTDGDSSTAQGPPAENPDSKDSLPSENLTSVSGKDSAQSSWTTPESPSSSSSSVQASAATGQSGEQSLTTTSNTPTGPTEDRTHSSSALLPVSDNSNTTTTATTTNTAATTTSTTTAQTTRTTPTPTSRLLETDTSLASKSSSSDVLDIENVDLSLEEEPWLAVGGAEDASDSQPPPSGKVEKQPDFFTTLSMNGLTQELASALTSLDGTSASYGDEDVYDDAES